MSTDQTDRPTVVWATDEQVEEFARPYFADHPAADHKDALDAFRATGQRIQSFQFARVADRLAPIPTLDTAEAATSFLAGMATRYEWVSVFWDRGWGDSDQKLEITVIQDGDGQLPLARVTPDVYRELRESGVIARNSLQTMKARRLHDYVAAASTEIGPS